MKRTKGIVGVVLAICMLCSVPVSAKADALDDEQKNTDRIHDLLNGDTTTESRDTDAEYANRSKIKEISWSFDDKLYVLVDNIPHSNLRPTKSLGVPETGSADVAGFMGFHKKRLRQEASSFL